MPFSLTDQRRIPAVADAKDKIAVSFLLNHDPDTSARFRQLVDCFIHGFKSFLFVFSVGAFTLADAPTKKETFFPGSLMGNFIFGVPDGGIQESKDLCILPHFILEVRLSFQPDLPDHPRQQFRRRMRCAQPEPMPDTEQVTGDGKGVVSPRNDAEGHLGAEQQDSS
ncbi:hypothetical protein SDC9_179735 [bioreactor metagenome]|uniref:Uncharacterized protein n=1 Tax=bioreactor metagenome TaxID=1076179 RepID=A0A645GZP7_9ZZZZ